MLRCWSPGPPVSSLVSTRWILETLRPSRPWSKKDYRGRHLSVQRYNSRPQSPFTLERCDVLTLLRRPTTPDPDPTLRVSSLTYLHHNLRRRSSGRADGDTSCLRSLCPVTLPPRLPQPTWGVLGSPFPTSQVRLSLFLSTCRSSSFTKDTDSHQNLTVSLGNSDPRWTFPCSGRPSVDRPGYRNF